MPKVRLIVEKRGNAVWHYRVNDQLLSEVEHLFYEEVVMVCPLYQSIADIILAQYNLTYPANFEEACMSYFSLVEAFSNIMNELLIFQHGKCICSIT